MFQMFNTCRAKKGAETDLYALIAQRRDARKEKFDTMFSSLVSRYGGMLTQSQAKKNLKLPRENLKARDHHHHRRRRSLEESKAFGGMGKVFASKVRRRSV